MLNVKDDAKIRVVVKHQSSSGSSPQIGQFETTLLDIAQHKYWDEWHGIVGQDCMSHGEMHVVFHWSLRTDAPKILPKSMFILFYKFLYLFFFVLIFLLFFFFS